MQDDLSTLVYSTDKGRIQPQDTESIPPHDGFIYISRETKGRKGKGVTLIWGFGVDTKTLKETAKKLKNLCGVGGSVKDYRIELQGDQRDTSITWLKQQGYAVKRVGG